MGSAMHWFVCAAVLIVVAACGGKAVVDGTNGQANTGGAGATGGTSATTSQGGSAQGGSAQGGSDPQGGGGAIGDTQCSCEGEPTFAPCKLPLMCCPCTQHCEDPETFNCSCSSVPTCL
jgi:hypothetical protein